MLFKMFNYIACVFIRSLSNFSAQSSPDAVLILLCPKCFHCYLTGSILLRGLTFPSDGYYSHQLFLSLFVFSYVLSETHTAPSGISSLIMAGWVHCI